MMGVPKMKRNNFFRIVSIMVSMCISSCGLAADETDMPLMDEIRSAAITTLCTDDNFLKKSRLMSEKCVGVATYYAEACNEITRPIVPEMNLDESGVVFAERFSSIGVLYLMCLQSSILLSDMDASSTFDKISNVGD